MALAAYIRAWSMEPGARWGSRQETVIRRQEIILATDESSRPKEDSQRQSS
jgi:hypothetical protein